MSRCLVKLREKNEYHLRSSSRMKHRITTFGSLIRKCSIGYAVNCTILIYKWMIGKTDLNNDSNGAHLQDHIKKESLTTNFSTCCKSDGDKSLLFPDQCNNSTMENKTRKYFKEDCYNITRNTQSCCQIKNLVYLGCFLYHHSRLRKNAQEPVEIFILRNRLKTLVNFNNDNLCVKLPKKKSLSGKQGTKKQHNENYCKDICKINETLEVFLSRWQQFTSSDECT